MDPNPSKFPILSYVMARLPSFSRSSPKSPSDPSPPDLELQSIHLQDPQDPHFDLSSSMPHLADPAVLAAMKSAVAEVAQTRSVLRCLGVRPDHESLDLARAKISQIDDSLSHAVDDLVRSPRPAEIDPEIWRTVQADAERELREAAEKEKMPFKAVVQLDDMHESYERLLREAEEKLVKIYDGHEDDVRGEGKGKEKVVEEGELLVNEEVIRILQEAGRRSVERVDLEGRQLRFLPEEFGRIKGLVSLNLSNNQLEVIPDSIAGLENLEELRVASNLLVLLPDSIGLLSNLKILDVSGNKLKSLPDSISKCRSLVELDASYNELAFLPTNIGYELVNLQKLWVHLNKLRSLPTSVCEMRSLCLIDAHFNELRGLPHDIGKLSNLESLNLSSNFSDMKELPPSFCDLSNLKELDLSNNQIHALPDKFGHLIKLTKLNLDQNPLCVPPMVVVNQGAKAVVEYMEKRWADILLQEQENNQLETESPTKAWLMRSTSKLGSLVTGLSDYLGVDRSPKDPCLDQAL